MTMRNWLLRQGANVQDPPTAQEIQDREAREKAERETREEGYRLSLLDQFKNLKDNAADMSERQLAEKTWALSESREFQGYNREGGALEDSGFEDVDSAQFPLTAQERRLDKRYANGNRVDDRFVMPLRERTVGERIAAGAKNFAKGALVTAFSGAAIAAAGTIAVSSAITFMTQQNPGLVEAMVPLAKMMAGPPAALFLLTYTENGCDSLKDAFKQMSRNMLGVESHRGLRLVSYRGESMATVPRSIKDPTNMSQLLRLNCGLT